MAISEGGLLTDEIRCQVWPRLLNVPAQVLDQEPGVIFTYSFWNACVIKIELTVTFIVIVEVWSHTVDDKYIRELVTNVVRLYVISQY